MTRLGSALALIAVAPVALLAMELVALASGASLVPLVEAAAGPICHHLPTRTLEGLPVCARCTGVYVGAALASAALIVPPRVAWLRAGLVAAMTLGTVGAGAALAELWGLVHTTNGLRVALGAGLGAPVPLIAALGARVLWAEGRPAAPARP